MLSPIKRFLYQLLAENGIISTMRVMSLSSLAFGAGLAVYGLWAGKDVLAVTQLVAVFVGAAFSGKIVQKFAEKKSEE